MKIATPVMYSSKNVCNKIMATKLFDSIIMLRFGKTKVAKEELYCAKKQ